MYLYSDRFLSFQLGQFFVSLLDLLVQRLVLDFKLLEIDHVQSVSQLFSRSERALQLLQGGA